MFQLLVPRTGEPYADEVYRLKATLEGEDPDEAIELMTLGAELVPEAISAEELAEREMYLPTLTVEGDTIKVMTQAEEMGWAVYTVSESGDQLAWGGDPNADLVHVIAFPPGETFRYTEEYIMRMLERDDCIIWTFRNMSRTSS